MQAIVYSDYGGPEVLTLADVDTPTPGPDEVLVKVRAAALNPVDWHFVRGAPYPLRMAAGGLTRPTRQRRVGADFAGTITAIGPDVAGFTIGDAVFGMAEGTLAEFVTVRADRAIARKPPRLTFEQAAGAPLAGLTALQALRDRAKLQSGQRILIVGAAGGIGTFAVQIAKTMGADVTGVQSTSAVDLVRSLGADRVIDYTKEDFTIGNAPYDVVFDNVCNRDLSDVLRVIRPGGLFVPNGGGSPEKGIRIRGLLRVMAARPFINQKIAMFVTKPNRADLEALAAMIQAGTVTPVVDRCYPLAATAQAWRHLESGHAHGKVVVTM